LQDLELGIQVNLASYDKNKKPKDIYSEILEPVNNAINKFGEENELEYGSLEFVKIIRKIMKIIAMTKVYNITNYGIREQIYSRLDKEKKDDENKNIIDSIASDIIGGLKKKIIHNKKRCFYMPS
jgi:DNA-directed RNA polymerase